MKTTRLALLAAALVVLSGVGCGTIRNLATKDPDVYGGVQKAAETTREASSDGGFSTNSAEAAAIALGLVVGDIALSAVGDTLTMPLILYRRRVAEAAEAASKQPAEESSPGVSLGEPLRLTQEEAPGQSP